MVWCIISLYVALRLANACLAISCPWSRMGPCFSGLLDGGALLAMLSGWCVGDSLVVVVWLARLGEVGWLVAITFSSGVGLGLV